MSTDNKIEFSLEKSQEVALHVEAMKTHLLMVDVEYLAAMAKQMRKDASNSASMAALNRNFDPRKNNLLVAQANALDAICDLHTAFKRCGDLKNEIELYDKHAEDIMKMFGHHG